MRTVPNGVIKNNRIYETIYHVETVTPEIPPLHEIDGYGLPEREQMFRRTTLPAGFSPLNGKSGKELEDYIPEHQAFIRREWDRRLNGYWFFNHGMLTYIDGGYYFELNFWHIDIGLKSYRDRDRRKWRFWQTQVDDPESFGCIYMKGRRDGATYWSGCINFEYASRTKNAHCGIQSKTGNDAASVFQKAVVKPFRKLPTFFIPIIANSDNPKKALEFSEPASKITKNNTKIKRSAALDSIIDFKPTLPESYDGEKLHRVHLDEQGKNTECKFTELWKIIRECLSTGGGKNIVGKAIITSTVAEGSKKGGDEFKKIWEQSDPTKLNANGRTVSGLKRLFITSADGMEGFIDPYGMSLIEEAKQFILNERKGLEDAGDYEGLAEHRRLYPLTENDAFTPPPKDAIFDNQVIDARMAELNYQDAAFIRRGDFIWKDGVPFTEVVWHDNPANGRWLVGDLIDNAKDRNKVEQRNGKWYPKNTENYGGAADPLDTRNPDGDTRRSRFAITVFRLYDMMQPEGTTNKFVALYLHRPRKPEDAYDDVIKACFYYGMDILPEMDKPGVANYMHEKGCGGFIAKRPVNTYDPGKAPKKVEEGMYGRTNTHEQIVNRWRTYVVDHGHLIDFIEILEDLKDFDVMATTKYDAVMAGGYNLIHVKRSTPRTQTKGFDIKDYFKLHRA